MDVFKLWEEATSKLPERMAGGLSLKGINFDADKHSGIITLSFNKNKRVYNLINLSKASHNIISFLKLLTKDSRKLLVMAPVIYPNIGEELVNAGINYVDSLGNFYIVDEDIFLVHLGQKGAASVPKEKTNRIFTEAGVKLLFGILNDPAFINLPYRQMSAAVNISMSSITVILKELMNSKYMHLAERNKKVLNHKKELLDRWAIAYKEQLKPKLLIGNYYTKSFKLPQDFKKIDIASLKAVWGGEAAGNLYSHYLSPQKITLFVDENEKNWMSTFRLIKATEESEIEVLRQFWNKDYLEFTKHIDGTYAVVPILAYADLITSNDSRKVETAQKIFDEYIQFTDR